MSKSINNNSKVEILETPDKLESDLLDYRLIRLQNGLTTLLISSHAKHITDADNEINLEDFKNLVINDIKEKKNAGVALSVDVGSLSDPPNIQGMAHFLEHMVHNGSKKYPLENEYSSYIAKSGGGCNAMTYDDQTIYYFDVNEDNLDGAIDRFVNMFISPLMEKNVIVRERSAVDSEFLSNRNEDSFRQSQILAEFMSDDYPTKLFHYGNKKTLGDDIDDDFLYDEMHKFHKRHYSAHRMRAVVQSKLPLDEIQDLAIKYFSDIPSNNLPGDDFSSFTYDKLFKDEFYNSIIYIKPISNVTKIEINWCMPSMDDEYLSDPIGFCSYFFSYGGPKSLKKFLKDKLWVTYIDGSSTASYPFINTLFTINFDLTENGFDHLNDVLNAVFYYIRILSETSGANFKEYYEEMKHISDIEFKYKEEIEPSINVINITERMKYYPLKHIITCGRPFYEFNEEKIQKFISHLNTQKFNITIMKQNVPGIVFDKIEKWCGTQYTTAKLPDDWRNLRNSNYRNVELNLPPKNSFIPTNFEILVIPENSTKYPEKILSTHKIDLWYKSNDVPKPVPKAFVGLKLTSPIASQSALNVTLAEIFGTIFRNIVSEELYGAIETGFYTSFNNSNNDYLLSFSWYNDKILEVIKLTIKLFVNCLEKLTELKLEMIKQENKKGFYDICTHPKYLQRSLELKIIENDYWSFWDCYNEFSSITKNDLINYHKEFLRELKIVVLVQGNLSKEEALSFAETILKNIQFDPISDETKIQERVTEIPVGDHVIALKSIDTTNVNTEILVVYPIGVPSIKLESIFELLSHLIAEPIYDTLRSKEELCYSVDGCSTSFGNYLRFEISITTQENKFRAPFIENRIEEFLKGFLKTLINKTPEEFDQFKNNLIRSKHNLIKEKDFGFKTYCNWNEIFKKHYIFDRFELEADAVKNITQDELIEFYKTFILNPETRRKISFQVIGATEIKEDTSEAKEMPEILELQYSDAYENDPRNINDFLEFKENLPMLPVVTLQQE